MALAGYHNRIMRGMIQGGIKICEMTRNRKIFFMQWRGALKVFTRIHTSI